MLCIPVGTKFTENLCEKFWWNGVVRFKGKRKFWRLAIWVRVRLLNVLALRLTLFGCRLNYLDFTMCFMCPTWANNWRTLHMLIFYGVRSARGHIVFRSARENSSIIRSKCCAPSRSLLWKSFGHSMAWIKPLGENRGSNETQVSVPLRIGCVS